jgi:hypothetical protein
MTDGTAGLGTVEWFNEVIRERLSRRLFAKRIMQNQIRPLYVEAMIEDALGPDWVYVGADWGGWDFDGPDGIKLEIKQSAASQSWSAGRGITTRPIFDIAPRSGFYGKDGVQWTSSPGRQAQVYVFAWHPVSNETADQRDPTQWLFYVVPAAMLPQLHKTISLKGVEARSKPVALAELKEQLSATCREVRVISD